MDYKMTNAERVLVLIIIVSVFIESIAAAPLLEDGSASPATRRLKNATKPHSKRKGQHTPVKKNLERWNNIFDDKAVETWKNPCESIGWVDSSSTIDNYNASYAMMNVSIKKINSSLLLLDKINSSDVASWEEFYNKTYAFLPTRPSGLVHKWHKHTQVYLASLTIIYERQKKEDYVNNDDTVSKELKDILDQARALLCDIEHFLNATSNRNGTSKPEWYERGEMEEIVKGLLDEKLKINNIFVKARFQSYIDKLLKRITNFNLSRNLEVKSLKRKGRTTLGPHRNRKNKCAKHRCGHKKRQWKTTTATERTFIITTKRPRRNKLAKIPGQRKHNKINQSLN